MQEHIRTPDPGPAAPQEMPSKQDSRQLSHTHTHTLIAPAGALMRLPLEERVAVGSHPSQTLSFHRQVTLIPNV